MPSPTSSTRPTSRALIVGSTSLIWPTSTEMISSARNGMAAPLDQLIAGLVDAGADAGVVDPVADAHDQPAQQVGIDLFLQDGFDLGHLPHVGAHATALVVGQRHGRDGV